MKYNFPVQYWGDHTRVQFEPFVEIPKGFPVTTCMVFVKNGDRVLLSRPKRGWGLPGGHKKLDESPEECAVREVMEETNVKVNNLRLVGGWRIKKIKDLESIRHYPDEGCQLLYVAEVREVGDFVPKFESYERKFVAIHEVENYHHDYESFVSVLDYLLDIIKVR